ncbi:MAG TPA: TetR/AcrR family transcriptional regulator C-terminal domain-containing protein [Polyangiales bacterium]|nr:TetR/AcrR family transcriptional regulator C-terminal domain-containing protein [Polyangiales bacterium]
MAKKSTKKPARRAPLSRERVLRAALQMADKDGLESLSMRRLAQALKVEAMSLYNHVANKEQILDGLVELVVGEIDLPAIGGDWRRELRARACSAHAVLMHHPWATMLLVARMNIGPNMLRYIDATIGCLREAGFSYPMADHAWTAIDAYVYGFTLQKLNFPLEPSEYVSAGKQFLPLIPVEQFPYMHGMSMEVIEGRHDGMHHLELGIDLLLDGLERLRAAG